MDKARLEYLLANTYIPPQPKRQEVSVPQYHPCLIMQDFNTDTTKKKACGCADTFCIKEAPRRISREPR